MLTKNQFTVLNALREEPGASQRSLASSTGLALGTVNAAVKSLQEGGLIADGAPTSEGMQALLPHKVRNAIILAAGLSSRFAPISYEKPKGVLKVRGEVLIERQIRQLKEAGIDEITVVVGYKKEYFFYLCEKYGVELVNNDEYASRNNNGSIWRVRDKLSNTFVCSSDDYFTENPFEPYVYKAYYAAQYAEGPTKEWCMTTGANDRITGVTIGGSDSWYMLGHVYFDEAFSKTFVSILEKEYERPETTDKLWEDLYIEHIKELDMTMRPYPEGIINEFDSLDELRAFDPHFLENVDSEIFDNICKTLGCSKSEIHDVYPLKQGLTNLSCHFSTNDGEYVYRHPGVGTELLVNRRGEVAALKKAKELGLDDTFIYEDPARGWKISKFVRDARQPNPHDAAQMSRMMQMCRRLHESGATVETEFDFYAEAKRYESLLLKKGPIEIPGYWNLAKKVDELEDHVVADAAPKCLCHNDFFYMNFLIDQSDKYYLIDWEYAGLSDYANDFGTCCVCCELTEDEVDAALDSYFGRKATEGEAAHNYAHIALAGWCWYLWSLLKEAEGDFVGEWLYIYYNYGVKYLNRALALYAKEK
ncbi:phosphotransferase [Paratractidigestivibacter faecalis]|uniref:phosphotransferase n=1 Tax=Paratractidigestivibacter faecalis TaxID=2292441 RepID=UPI003D01822A